VEIRQALVEKESEEIEKMNQNA